MIYKSQYGQTTFGVKLVLSKFMVLVILATVKEHLELCMIGTQQSAIYLTYAGYANCSSQYKFVHSFLPSKICTRNSKLGV